MVIRVGERKLLNPGFPDWKLPDVSLLMPVSGGSGVIRFLPFPALFLPFCSLLLVHKTNVILVLITCGSLRPAVFVGNLSIIYKRTMYKAKLNVGSSAAARDAAIRPPTFPGDLSSIRRRSRPFRTTASVRLLPQIFSCFCYETSVQ